MFWHFHTIIPVTMPADKHMQNSPALIWLFQSSEGNAANTNLPYLHPPQNKHFIISRGNPGTFQKLKYLTSFWWNKGYGISSPLLCIDAFPIALFIKYQLLSQITFQQRPSGHIKRIQAEKGQCNWSQGGEDSSVIFRNSLISKVHLHTHYTLRIYISLKLKNGLSPEFWSIHCSESMCAFKILQICWSWTEREGESYLLQYIKTNSSKRQPSCPHLRSTKVIFLIHAIPLIRQSFLLCSNCASLLLLDIKKTDLEYMPVA